MTIKTETTLITGASGYVGGLVVRELILNAKYSGKVIALDVRSPREEIPGVLYLTEDIRQGDFAEILKTHGVDTVVHLAAIVNPGNSKEARDFEYAVDVLGTRNVLEACIRCGVKKFIYSSSGAAYGYHADNPDWLSESDRLRGNDEFSYSRNKRIVEETLERYRREHPELSQLIFRPGTILGENVSNSITNLFHKKMIMGIKGSDSPFVFIWDWDVVSCIVRGIEEDRTGIYNLAGDGYLTLREIAARLKKTYLAVPPGLLRAALWLLSRLGLTRYGPEQLNFLRYRPVLDNANLKSGFGYTPKLASAEVFDLYRKSAGL